MDRDQVSNDTTALEPAHIFKTEVTAEQHTHLLERVSGDGILMAPGVTDPSEHYYSIDQPDFAKRLAEQGATVEWADPPEKRQFVDLKSAEIWLGTLIITVLGGAAAQLIARALEREIDDRDIARVHMRIVVQEDGRTLEASGPATEVVKALKEFLRRSKPS